MWRSVAIGLSLILASGCFLDRAGRDESTVDAGIDAGPCRPEQCNGEDDDCDDRIDENASLACGMPGSCSAGVQQCLGGVLGPCIPAGIAGDETCEGAIDEDCDGSIDEGCSCTPATQMGCGTDIGECVRGTQTCLGDGTWGPCMGSVSPQVEQCNARDDDCDGNVDGNTESCGTETGACVPGLRSCEAGTWGACGGVGPADERCDAEGEDEDCDGMINEGCTCLLGDPPVACTLGGCEGVRTCLPTGVLSECEPTGIGTELCNGLDDDCDGTIDETATCAGCEHRTFGGHAYLLCMPSTPRNWDEARVHCASLGYSLAIIETQAENDFLQAETSPLAESVWWIGLRDATSTSEDYRWIGTEQTPDEAGFVGWEPGEPSHNDQCAQLSNTLGGAWDDKNCGDEGYICEAPPPSSP